MNKTNPETPVVLARPIMIYRDDFAALAARKRRTGIPMVRLLHEAITAMCSTPDAPPTPTPPADAPATPEASV